MRTSKFGVLVLASVFLVGALSGCATKKDTGTLVGATAGGLLGHVAGGKNHVATAVFGAVLGGAVGQSIGEHMDESDHKMIAVILDEPKTTPTTWSNPSKKTENKVTPGPKKPWKNLVCRDLSHKQTKDGKTITVHTTSCKKDGKWVEMIPKD